MEKPRSFSSTHKKTKSTRILTLTFWRHPCCQYATICTRQWFRLNASQCSITPHWSKSEFSLRQHARFHQLTRMDAAFARYELVRLLSLGYLARTCLRRKAWTICEPQRSLDKWHDVDDLTVRKSYIALEKALFSAVAKQNGGPVQHIFCLSVHWWLLWCSDVAACKHCYMTCNTISFVSWLIWKCFRRELLTYSKMFAHYIHAFLLIHSTTCYIMPC